MSDFHDLSKREEALLRGKKAQERADNDLKKVLSIVEGRRFIFNVLARAGIWKSSFTGNSSTFFLEGARSQGLFLLDHMMKVSPEKFTQMIQENYSEMMSLKKQEENKNGTNS